MSEPQVITLSLNPENIGHVALSSARETADVVGLALQLMEEAGPNAIGKHQSAFMQYDFGQPTGTPSDRYEARRHWLLMKGFQDITLATRRALEEADYILDIASSPQGVAMDRSELRDKLIASRRAGNEASLPDLINRIQRKISSEIKYKESISSLNRARNVLEHRRGIVTRKDCDKDQDYLTISYPRMMMYYILNGQEIEIDGPLQLPDDPNVETIPLMAMRRERQIRFFIGEPIILNARNFAEITFAVWFFATALVEDVVRSPALANLAAKQLPEGQA